MIKDVGTENGREREPSGQTAALAANAAHTALGAAKTGNGVAGALAGTAAGGLPGLVIGFLITKKTFWKAVLSVLAAVFLLIAVIVNLFGILLAWLGLADADGYVSQAKTGEAGQIKDQVEMLMENCPEEAGELFDMLDGRRDRMVLEIEADYRENYGSLEQYEMELADEYENCLKPEFATYLSVLFAGSWNGSQIRTFLGNGTADLFSTELSSPYDSYFDQAQEMYGVDSALLKAVAKVESDFTPDAVSYAGAVGIMQLMPKTAESLGVLDPYDPKQNILGGAKYLAGSLAAFGGHENQVELAVASYHAGIGAVRRAGYRIPEDGKTPGYVEKVLGYVEIAESGSLTPGREGPQKGDRRLQMLLREVYGRQEFLFSWAKEGVREEEREVAVCYRRSAAGQEEISEEDYQAYLNAGESGLSVEKEVQLWHVVSYRIVNLLDAGVPGSRGSYSYKFVTTPKRFLRAVEMLKFLSGGQDSGAFMDKFGWKELVDGYDAFEASFDTDAETEGEAIRYDTAGGCIQEVVYYNQNEDPWASMEFAGTTIKASGCGPVSMAIVISTLTGQMVTPADTARYADAERLYVPGKGTSHSLPAMAAKEWGLSVKRVRREQVAEVQEGLRQGALAVVICGEYTITGSGSGHYIVLTGVTDEGYFTIADPASRERSGRIYSPDTIRMYARNLDAGSIWIIGK